MCRLTPQMNVTEIAKVAAENGKEPDWGRVMSEIPKVWKWMEKKIQVFILSIQQGAQMGKNNGYNLLLDSESYDNSRFGSSVRRVPDTRPDPIIFTNTRTRPEIFSE